MSSPTSAPRNGPAIIPTGPAKNPMISPIVEPIVAALLPPSLSVIMTGRKLSRIETTTATTKVIARHTNEISLIDDKKHSKSPSQARGAPGRTGTKVPRKPKSKRIAAKTVKTMLKAMFIKLSLRFLLSKKSIPQKHNLIPEKWEKQKDFERIMKYFYKDFVSAVKGLFFYTSYALRENAKAVLVIKEDA